MSKRVVLRLDGDINSGFRVTLEIGQQGQQPDMEMQGRLPPISNLSKDLNQWQSIYRSLGTPTRLKPKSVSHYSQSEWLPTAQEISFEDCRNSSDVLQRDLVSWLESPEFRKINDSLREELSRDDEIQLIIRADDSSLVQLPWHLWNFIERYSKAEVTFGCLDARRVKRHRQPKEKVRILAILGNSTGINIESDRQMLCSLPNAEVTLLVEPQRKEINDKLWNQNWDVLFFAGHSETLSSKGIIHINPKDSLGIEDLKYGLNQAIENGLQIAIFNSCDGLGLAQALEQLNIPQMIVMRQPVPDYVAQEFLKSFLNFYAIQGETFHIAERKAREFLQGLEDDYPCASWLPIVFQNPIEVPPTWVELQGKQVNNSNFEQQRGHQSVWMSDASKDVSSGGTLTSASVNQTSEVPVIGMVCPSFPSEQEFEAVWHSTGLQEMNSNTGYVDFLAPLPNSASPQFEQGKIAPYLRGKENEIRITTQLHGVESERAKVTRPIHPYYVGRVWYQGTTWHAFFLHPERAKTVESGQEVEVIGTWGSYLVVMPEKGEETEKPKNILHAFLSSFKPGS